MKTGNRTHWLSGRGPVRHDRGGTDSLRRGGTVGRKIRAWQRADGRDPAEPVVAGRGGAGVGQGGQHHGTGGPRGDVPHPRAHGVQGDEAQGARGDRPGGRGGGGRDQRLHELRPDGLPHHPLGAVPRERPRHPRRHARELGLRPRGAFAGARGDPRGGADERGRPGAGRLQGALPRGVQGPPVRAPRHRLRRHDPEDHARGSPGLLPRELRSREHGARDRGGGGSENVPAADREDVRAASPRFRADRRDSGRAAAEGDPGRRQGEGRAARLHRHGVPRPLDEGPGRLRMGPAVDDPRQRRDVAALPLGEGRERAGRLGVRVVVYPEGPGAPVRRRHPVAREGAGGAQGDPPRDVPHGCRSPGGAGARAGQDGDGDGFPVLPRVAVGAGPPRGILRDHVERRGVRADVPAQDPGGDRRRHPDGGEEVPFPREPVRFGRPSHGEGGDSSRRGGPRHRAAGVRRGDRAGRGARKEADRGEGGPPPTGSG